MKILFCAISMFGLLSSQCAVAETTKDCKPVVEKAIIFLLSLEGHSVEYCGKDIYSPASGCLTISGGPLDANRAIYGGQYIFGGAYYNVDDYTVRVYGDCQIEEIKIERN